MGAIYKITNNINGFIYIGQDAHNRPNYYGSGTIIRHAIKKYGRENFSREVLEVCDRSKLNEREIYWIEYYASTNTSIGYNISKGGGQFGHLKYYIICELLDNGKEQIIDELTVTNCVSSELAWFTVLDFENHRVFFVRNLAKFCSIYSIPYTETTIFYNSYTTPIYKRWGCYKDKLPGTKCDIFKFCTTEMDKVKLMQESKWRQPRAKYTIVNHKNPSVYFTDNLKSFCGPRGLPANEFRVFSKSYYSLIYGEWAVYNGYLAGDSAQIIDYSVKFLEKKVADRIARCSVTPGITSKVFTVVDHELREVHHITGLRIFCKIHGINENSLGKVESSRTLFKARWGCYRGHIQGTVDEIIRYSKEYAHKLYTPSGVQIIKYVFEHIVSGDRKEFCGTIGTDGVTFFKLSKFTILDKIRLCKPIGDYKFLYKERL